MLPTHYTKPIKGEVMNLPAGMKNPHLNLFPMLLKIFNHQQLYSILTKIIHSVQVLLPFKVLLLFSLKKRTVNIFSLFLNTQIHSISEYLQNTLRIVIYTITNWTSSRLPLKN